MDPTAAAIAKVLGPVFLMMGLSLLVYCKQWTKILDRWQKNHLELFSLMMMSTVLGLILVNMYNVWEWRLELLVTLAGWSMLLKGLFYFLAPGCWITAGLKLGKNTGLMYLSGVVAVVVGAVLSYYVYLV